MKKKLVKEYVIIALGCLLVALALHFFYFPANLAAGGVSGVSIILEKLFPFFTKANYVLALNVLLFIIGWILLGANFGWKTIFASFFMAFALDALERFVGPYVLTRDMFLNTFYGTLIASIGMAFVFNQGASTGGTDIIAKILNRYFHIDIGKSLMFVDFIVTLGGFILFGPEVGLFALLSVLINGPLIDRIIDGLKTAKEIMIITKEQELITNFILNELERGCTILKGYGGYTKQDINVIYCVLNRSDYIKLKDYIRKTDPRAFLSVNEVREVLGEGYEDISLL